MHRILKPHILTAMTFYDAGHSLLPVTWRAVFASCDMAGIMHSSLVAGGGDRLAAGGAH
jgi:hypothetical protein